MTAPQLYSNPKPIPSPNPNLDSNPNPNQARAPELAGMLRGASRRSWSMD